LIETRTAAERSLQTDMKEIERKRLVKKSTDRINLLEKL
jgi:hypothetical protein